MGHRLDQFQEFVLVFESPWNLGSATTHKWSHGIYVTGTIDHTDAEAEAAALDLASVTLQLAQSHTSLVQAKYYKSGSLVSTWEKIYAPGTHAGTAAAYADISGSKPQQLEVAAVAHCPIGINTKGKEIYLRRYFHDVLAASDPNSLAALAGVDPLTIYNTGAGPHKVTPCSPTSGHAGTGPWVMEHHLFTHQLRRKKKKKPSANLINQLEDLGLSVAQALAVRALLAAA